MNPANIESAKLRSVIIDDELHCTEILKYELQRNCPEIEIMGVAHSGKEGIALIKELSPDIIFLDIEMPEINGFDVLSSLDNCSSSIVFVTAFDHYALKAIKYSASDYLLKPVSGSELKNTVEKIILQRSKNQVPDYRLLLQNLMEGKESGLKVALIVGNKLEFVKRSDIIRCQADGNYTNVFTTDERKIYVSRGLKELVQLLEGSPFIKCHQSHLINLDFIRTYDKSEGGSLVMNNGDEIPISRNQKDFVVEAIMEHLKA